MATKSKERPDPVPWLERLCEVNAKSDFTSEQKIIINSHLKKALQELGAEVPTTV